MKLVPFISILLLVVSPQIFAQDLIVQADQMGQLTQEIQPIKQISSYAGKDLLAEVKVLPGQSYVLQSLMNVQRLVFLKSPGESVRLGEPFAQLIGPEVHHYYSEYQIKKSLYLQSKSLFENNRKLYANKSLSEQAWLSISQAFYATKLDFDEFTHFFELMLKFDESNESLTLGAPMAGIIQYAHSDSVKVGDEIGRFTPNMSIRLSVNLPISSHQQPYLIRTDQCNLLIDKIENQSNGYYQLAWSAPIDNACQLNIGQTIRVTPQYKASVYQVNKSSVFNWEGDNYLFVSQEKNYVAKQVELITSVNDDYIVFSQHSLEGEKALVSSVSAAQGILMGFGGQ